MSSPTRIADDAAAIAQAMKALGLEKSVPIFDRIAEDALAIKKLSDELDAQQGWQIHDDDWMGLAMAWSA